MEQTIQIEPCPHCGKSSGVVVMPWPPQSNSTVKCESCRTPWIALDIWQRRPTEAALRSRIAELENVHLVEDGDLPDEGKTVLCIDYDNFPYTAEHDKTQGWIESHEGRTLPKIVVWIELPDLLKLAEIKRAKRGANG